MRLFLASLPSWPPFCPDPDSPHSSQFFLGTCTNHFCSEPCLGVYFWTQPKTGQRRSRAVTQKDIQGKYDEIGPSQWLSVQPGGSEAKADGEGGAEALAELESESQHCGQRQIGGEKEGTWVLYLGSLHWLGLGDHSGV